MTEIDIRIKYWQRQFQILVLGLLILAIVFLILLYLTKTNENSKVCYDIASLNKTFDTIKNNCGNVFITKKYGSNDWFIFRLNICDGKKCENIYIPVEDCLKSLEEKEERVS